MTPIVCTIAVFRKATGELLHLTTPELAPAPSDANLQAIALPAGYDDQTWGWDAVAMVMVEDPARVEELLLADLKVTAEQQKMLAVSPGGAKKLEYDDKGAEIAGSATIAAADLNGLSRAEAMAQFPAAATEQALTGEPLATILARYRAGAETSMPEIRRISAIEQDASRRIRAGQTGAAKRAAAAAIDWAWKP